MQKRNWILPIIALVAVTMAFMGCKDQSDDEDKTSLVIYSPENGYVAQGGSIDIFAETNLTADTYVWTVEPVTGAVSFNETTGSTLKLKGEEIGSVSVTVSAGDATSKPYTVRVKRAVPGAISLDNESLEINLKDDRQITAEIDNFDELDAETRAIVWTSSDEGVATVSGSESVATVKAVGAGSATITASTVNGKTATCSVTVTRGSLDLSDEPVGYASLGTSYATSATNAKTVSNRTELINAVKSGGVIIIDGMIDMSDGRLVAAGKKSTDSTPALDDFVKSKSNSSYTTYSAWVEAYSKACQLTTEDDKADPGNSDLQSVMKELNEAYGKIIRLDLESNTTLIGKGPGCGIRGGTIQISGKSNIQIRNLTIQDPFDPFPHHEANDGYNAQWDGVNIQGKSENIWIDHCTFEDTIDLGYVNTNGSSQEKWQTYDGLCDMKNNSTNITVSNCKFQNHDKTMLIGSSDSDGDNSKRFVTLYGNYFYNCGQRLPMVRNTTIHILNNYYDASSPHYSQSYAVGCRKNSIIYAEGNYFGSGIQYSFKDNDGTLYASGNTDNSSKRNSTTIKGSTLFKDAVKAYTYTAVSADAAKTNAESNAGAGYTLK